MGEARLQEKVLNLRFHKCQAQIPLTAREHGNHSLDLIEKALGMRKHLAENKRDIHNKRQLMLTESKVRRLVKYYVSSKKLPKGWVYKPDTAEILLSR